MTLVSFVIPTLDRVGYVNRSVRSCLAQVEPGRVEVQVVVLDSESTDGSWDSLTAEFGNHPDVLLLQNKRGSGPMRSWLDGARYVKGEVVTFVWSDDYVFPDFCSALLPAIIDGDAEFSFGGGLVRDIDDDEPVADASEIGRTTSEAMAEAYLGGLSRWTPLSPTCALFARSSFDAWSAAVEGHATGTELRRQVQWRRAIGPDLLLFLTALAASDGQVGSTERFVAQFSHHPGSITVSADKWPLSAGYWLATCTAVTQLRLTELLDRRMRAAAVARIAMAGVKLYLRAPGAMGPELDRAAVRREIRREIRTLLDSERSAVGYIGVLTGAVVYARGAVARRIQS